MSRKARARRTDRPAPPGAAQGGWPRRPGMPIGSPGMEVAGSPAQRYRVFTFDKIRKQIRGLVWSVRSASRSAGRGDARPWGWYPSRSPAFRAGGKRGETVPNITIQWFAGRTDQQRREITAAITEAMVRIGKTTADQVHIVFQDVEKSHLGYNGKLASD